MDGSVNAENDANAMRQTATPLINMSTTLIHLLCLFFKLTKDLMFNFS